VFDGAYSRFRRRRFGAPADDLPPDRFVVYSQNHDQVGNRAFGDRLAPELQRLGALITLTVPFVPLLFMGEEYGERAPFQFFSNHIDQEIAVATREGRQREFAAFASFDKEVPDPEDPGTFERSKLTRERLPETAALYAGLIEARAELVSGDAEIEFSEPELWIRARRGPHEIVCNFNPDWAKFDCSATEIALATDDRAVLSDGSLKLPPMSGALVR
jgi:maltooligosyltrehalose trehalohydrolase